MSYIGTGVETVTFNTATTLNVAGNITLGGTVDGRDVATDGTKLDTITSGAIADILQDTTPQLGGNLDLNTSNVIGTGNINVTGSITGTSFVSTGNMSFTNNSKAIFGTSPSLEIYHDGSNSILDDVGAGNFKMQLAGADKLEITSTGVNVTGTVTADGLIVQGNSGTSSSVVFGYNENGGEITLHDETGAAATLIDQASNNTRLLELVNGSDLVLGLGGSNTTGNIRFNSAGYSTAMTIDSIGNVGIGTSSPAANLHVVTSDFKAAQFEGPRPTLFFKETDGNANENYQIRLDGGSLLFQSQNDLQSNAVNRMTINSSGNVGIGTSNPGMLLDVDASGSGANDIARFSGRNSAGLTFRNATSQDFIIHTATSDALIFGTNGNNERLRITSGGDLIKVGGVIKGERGTAAAPAYSFSDDTDTGMFNIANTDLGFSVGGTERMRITSAGSVGIGTSSPTHNLTVGSTAASDYVVALRGGVGGFFGWDDSANTTVLQSPNTRSLSFQVNSDTFSSGTEAMRISSGASVLVGTTVLPTSARFASAGTTGTFAGVFVNGVGSQAYGVAISSGTGEAVYFYHGGTIGSPVGSISTNASSTSYNTSSDYRLKTAVEYDWDATTRLKQLKPARFAWIADGDDAVPVDGFLAHEVQDIVPEAISGTKDAVDEDGNPVYQGIDQSKLVPLLVKTIQELEARIAALENT